MESEQIFNRDEEITIFSSKENIILIPDNTYGCTNCPYPVEIFKIDDSENTVTFKCLNPNEKNSEKTISIVEYLDLMIKNTYLYSKCSLCQKKQNEFKDIQIFSYCITCDAIICSECITKHLKLNEKNHPNLNTEYIIKNNEKSVKCLLHPKKKNLAFCLECNIHICKECKKSKKHIDHRKNDILEISLTDETKIMLNDIINIYKDRIKQLAKEKEIKETELLNEKKINKSEKKKQKKNKIKEIQKKLKKELEENAKLLNYNLYKLKIKYENEVKLCKKKFKICNENINKKYERIGNYYNNIFDKELDNIEKEYIKKLIISNKIKK